MRFLDTNILLRYLTRDDEEKAQAALALLSRLGEGTEVAVTSPLVLFEVIFTLNRVYKEPKERVVQLVLPVLLLRGLQLPNKKLWQDAFRLWLSSPIDFADAYNAAYMRSRRITEIYSWDEGFDKVPGIRRVEP